MKRITKQGQSFVDKVVQYTGNFENVLEMALLNGKSITDDLEIGEELKASSVTNKRVVDFFNTTNEPATTLNNLQKDEVENLGIGKMIIESTFIVR